MTPRPTRFFAWGALLALEGLVLGIRFDAESLEGLPRGWWTGLLKGAGAAMPILAACLAASVLVFRFGGSAADKDAGRKLFPPGRRAGTWGYVGLQLAVWASLFALSLVLFNAADAGLSARAVGWLVAGWLLAAAATFATWVAIALPPAQWGLVLRNRAREMVWVLVLGVGAYAVGLAVQGLWRPLRAATFAAVGVLLPIGVPDAVVDADQFTLGTHDFTVGIAPACSGYEGIGLTVVFLAAALWLFRSHFRFPRAFLLILLGAVSSWLANVVRLTILVVIGARLSPEIAAGAFHSYAGIIFFCAISLGIVWLAMRSPWFSREAGVDAGDSNPAAPYLVPLLAMVAAELVASAFRTATRDPGWALRPLVGLLALAAYRRGVRRAVAGDVSAWGLGAGVGVAIVWLVVERLRPAGVAGGGESLGLLHRLVTAAAAVGLVPFVEELAFRGFLARRISSGAFDRVEPTTLSWIAILGSSLAFGLLHQRMVLGALAGVAYALVYRRRGSLLDAVVAHAVTNLLLVIAGLALGLPGIWR